MTPPQARKSDLGVRAASAAVMIAIAGIALWLGGWAWVAFVGLVAAGVLWEWRALVRGFDQTPLVEVVWISGGVVYIGIATATLMALRELPLGFYNVLQDVCAVIAVDMGAYFAGRTFGGPKIAPRISPSKTWSGLVGGILGASAVLTYAFWREFCAFGTGLAHSCTAGDAMAQVPDALAFGAAIAIVAQSGDFFESWMKRRAGVKDSGTLIPGHGGLFDRVDGLLAVMFVIGVFLLFGAMTAQ